MRAEIGGCEGAGELVRMDVWLLAEVSNDELTLFALSSSRQKLLIQFQFQVC